MKRTLTLLFAIITLNASAQVASKVYSFEDTEAIGNKKLFQKTFFDGPTRDFSQMTLQGLIAPKKIKLTIKDPVLESLIIVKTGEITFELNGTTQTMGPGSIALLMPGETLKLKSDDIVSLYLMTYLGKEGNSQARGKENGGSFMKDWDDIEFKTHDRGGIRNYFNQPTANCERMEMHVSNLNEGIKSHEPHTHRAAEIVLMIKGHAEMEINGEKFQGYTGDIYYLGSDDPHAIENVDDQQIQYFAYQFE